MPSYSKPQRSKWILRSSSLYTRNSVSVPPSVIHSLRTAVRSYASESKYRSTTPKRLHDALVRCVTTHGRGYILSGLFTVRPTEPKYQFDSPGFYGIPLRIAALQSIGGVQNYFGSELYPHTIVRRRATLAERFHVLQYLQSTEFSKKLLIHLEYDCVVEALISYLLEWDDASLQEFAADTSPSGGAPFASLLESVRVFLTRTAADHNPVFLLKTTLDRRTIWKNTAAGRYAFARAQNDPTYDLWRGCFPPQYGNPQGLTATAKTSPNDTSRWIFSYLPQIHPKPMRFDDDSSDDTELTNEDSEDPAQHDECFMFDVQIPVTRCAIKILRAQFNSSILTPSKWLPIKWSSFMVSSFKEHILDVARAVCSVDESAISETLLEEMNKLPSEKLPYSIPMTDKAWSEVRPTRCYDFGTPNIVPLPEFVPYVDPIYQIGESDQNNEDLVILANNDDFELTKQYNDLKTAIDNMVPEIDSSIVSQEVQASTNESHIYKYITGQTCCGKTTLLTSMEIYGWIPISRSLAGSFGGKAVNGATIGTMYAALKSLLIQTDVIGDRSLLDNIAWVFIMSELDPYKYKRGIADPEMLVERLMLFLDSIFNEPAMAEFVKQKGFIFVDPYVERNRIRQLRRCTDGDPHRARLTNYHRIQCVIYYALARLFGYPVVCVSYTEDRQLYVRQSTRNFILNYFGQPVRSADSVIRRQRYPKPTNEYIIDHQYAKCTGIYK